MKTVAIVGLGIMGHGMAAGELSHPLMDEVTRQYQAAIDQGLAQADWTKINKL